MKSILSTLLLLGIFVTPTYAETITVAAGGNLQAALNAAQPGDVIKLEAGATFLGNFRFPIKPEGAPIVLTSMAELPARRITPTDVALLPTIGSPNGAAALTIHDTASWTLDGLHLRPNVGGTGEVIWIFNGLHVYMDRLLLVVPEGQQQKRGIYGNGRHITLTRSHIAGVWKQGQDSQAFCAIDGAGPYTVTDNYLEAASENVMFGGGNSTSPDRIPSDIYVARNHLRKPLEWKGKGRVIKNLFELKQARRGIVEDNLFENNWGGEGQSGYGILFTVANDDGGSPWALVEDVIFRRNTLRNSDRGIQISGHDPYQLSGQATRIKILDNDLGSPSWLFSISNLAGEIEIGRNTATNTGFKAYFDAGGRQIDGTKWPYAVEKLIWYENAVRGGFFADGQAVSLTTPYFVKEYLTATPEPEPEPEPDPDPLAPLTARLATLEAENAALKDQQAKLLAGQDLLLARIAQLETWLEEIRAHLLKVPAKK